MTIRTDTEHEARQLAARYFPDKGVQIIAGTFKGAECCFLEAGSDKGIVRATERLLFEGLGREAGTIDPPLAWTETPTWKRGLWARRIRRKNGALATAFLEWDGLGDTPDVELPDVEGETSAWLGPLPPIPA